MNRRGLLGIVFLVISALVTFQAVREVILPRREVLREAFQLTPLAYREFSILCSAGVCSFRMRVSASDGVNVYRVDNCFRTRSMVASRVTYLEYPRYGSYEMISAACRVVPPVIFIVINPNLHTVSVTVELELLYRPVVLREALAIGILLAAVGVILLISSRRAR